MPRHRVFFLPAHRAHGDTVEVVCTGPIIAADGAGSALRRAMGDAGLTTFTEDLLDHSYATRPCARHLALAPARMMITSVLLAIRCRA